MSAFKRKNGRWYFRKRVLIPGGGRRRVFGTPGPWGLPNTRAGAEAAEAKSIVEVLAGRSGKPPKLRPEQSATTLSVFAPKFIEWSETKNKHSSIASKRQILRDHIEPALGGVELHDLTYARVEDFRIALIKKTSDGKRALSDKTVNNILTVLHKLLDLACRRGFIVAVPPFEWLRPDAADFDFLTFEEADKLEAGTDEEWRTMVVVALRCGLRQGELLGLQWDDVDFTNGQINVRHNLVRSKLTTTKNRKGRLVPLGDEVAAALKSSRHLRGRFVFCDADGHWLKPSECKWPLYRACAKAGLRRVGWHVLRHSFASHLVIRGVPLNTVRELMGHATMTMTLRYAHLSPDVKHDAVRTLDRKRR